MSAADDFSSGDPAFSDSTNPNKRPRRLVDSADHKFDKCTTLSTLLSRYKISSMEKMQLLDFHQKYLKYWESSFASAWFSESDWQDQAYQELLFIRNAHSSLLQNLYSSSVEDRLQDIKGARAQEEYFKKLLNFLGKSRDGISALSKEECYDRMMDIKCVVAYHAEQDNGKYEKLQYLREKYSCKLDDAYYYLHGGHTESKSLTIHKEDCISFLEQSLNLFGRSRADMVYHSKEISNKILDDIERFGEERFGEEGRGFDLWEMYSVLRESADFSSCKNRQESRSPNWRDTAYEELKSLDDEAPFDDYRTGYSIWVQFPRLYKLVDELSDCLRSAEKLFSISRSEMALISQEEHAMSVKEITQVLARLEDVVSRLQKAHPITDI